VVGVRMTPTPPRSLGPDDRLRRSVFDEGITLGAFVLMKLKAVVVVGTPHLNVRLLAARRCWPRRLGQSVVIESGERIVECARVRRIGRLGGSRDCLTMATLLNSPGDGLITLVGGLHL